MSSPAPDAPASPYGPVTAPMVTHLHAMRPWMMLLGIVGCIGAVMMAGVSLFLAVLSAPFVSAGAASGASGLMGAFSIVLLAHVGLAVLVFFSSVALVKGARAIAAMRAAPSIPDLTAAMESALACQRRFWKLAGVTVLISLALQAVLFLLQAGRTAMDALFAGGMLGT